MSSLLVLSVVLSAVYLFSLSRRLRGSQKQSKPTFTTTELDNVTYDDIDLLDSIPRAPTLRQYVVIGGSGFLGTYIIRLLLLRGETKIYILDLSPPAEPFVSHPSVSFIQTDITSLQSVRESLVPCKQPGGPPTVIYHTAAIIRFWERLAYCWDASYNVNVRGTANVIAAASELPSAVLVYTSTADTVIPRPRFLRLGWGLDSSTFVVHDSDEPLSSAQLSESCYSRTKLGAEQLVKEANKTLPTGIIRPGYTIMGPNDRLITSTLAMPRVPVFDKQWSSTNICVWDAAAAHLLLEDALVRNITEARGQAFLVTGKDAPWSLKDSREAVKHFSTRNIILDDIPPLIIFILAHIIEASLFIRYHLLLLLLPFGLRPRLVPHWMGQLVYLQPSTLEYLCHKTIDDSRARDILGYRPQWSTAQCIRYAVHEIESGSAGSAHGLQLKAQYMQ